jgi:hypothetical protein
LDSRRLDGLDKDWPANLAIRYGQDFTGDTVQIDFVIIGAQKAGSTYLQEGLRQHPQVFMPHGETPFFQDPDYTRGDMRQLEHQLKRAKYGQRLGIKRPNYLAEHGVAERLADDLPGVKIIAILREPVSRAISAYFHYMRGGFIPVAPIEIGLPRLLRGDYSKDWPIAEHVITYGYYGRHLERYYKCIPRDRIKVIIMEDMHCDPVLTLRDLYHFVNVDETFLPQSLESRPMSAIYSLTRLRIGNLLKPLYMRRTDSGTRLWQRQGPFFNAVRMGCVGLDRYLLAHVFTTTKPNVPTDIKDQLTAFYREDMNKLRQLLGRDLCGWPA